MTGSIWKHPGRVGPSFVFPRQWRPWCAQMALIYPCPDFLISVSISSHQRKTSHGSRCSRIAKERFYIFLIFSDLWRPLYRCFNLETFQRGFSRTPHDAECEQFGLKVSSIHFFEPWRCVMLSELPSSCQWLTHLPRLAILSCDKYILHKDAMTLLY